MVEKILDPEQEQVERALKEKKEKQKEAKRRKALRNEITHKLRFDVLERDNYKCQYCGASPKNAKPDEEIELVVDHIVPLDKGGNNELDNLITACHDCNEGKKARLLKRTELKRVYDISEEKQKEIFALVEESDFDKYKVFWKDKENEEVRQLMYDMNEIIPGQECIKDCARCCETGLWYYKGCFQILNRYLKTGDGVHDTHVQTLLPTIVKDLSVITTGEKIPIVSSATNTLKCDTCYISKTCPQYKTGSFCKFEFRANADFSSPVKSMATVVAMQQERVNRAMFFEKMGGGAMDKNVTGELVLLSNLLKQFANMGQPSASIKIEASGSGNGGTSVVEQMMNNIFNKKEDREVKANVEEVEYEESKD